MGDPGQGMEPLAAEGAVLLLQRVGVEQLPVSAASLRTRWRLLAARSSVALHRWLVARCASRVPLRGHWGVV